LVLFIGSASIPDSSILFFLRHFPLKRRGTMQVEAIPVP